MNTAGHKKEDGPKLLVVDDEEGLLFLILDALRREGFEAEGVGSGEEAVQWLERNHADLLLLDLKLHDLPAPALMDRLRQRGQDIPFLIVTGHGDERTAVEMMKQGALDYVMKEAGMLEFLPGNARRAWSVIQRERQLAEANAAVRQREERLRKIVQTALDGFARCDADWRFLEVNDAFCEMLGYDAEELRAMKLGALEIGVTQAQLAARSAQLRDEGLARWFTRLKARNGRSLEVEISMRSEAGEFFAFIHDLSEQRQLERQVLQVSDSERRRFGHELHDGLGQQLTAIELMSHTLARELKAKAVTELSKSAYKIAELTRKTIAQTRQLAHGLAPVALDSDGVVSALNDLAHVTSGAGVECDFKAEEGARIDDLSIATHLFRVAQEAVTNALRHGKPTKVTIRLAPVTNGLELRVEDNGCGFTKKKKSGMGLGVMQHRARLIGAQLTVDSSRGKGTRVICFLPNQP